MASVWDDTECFCLKKKQCSINLLFPHNVLKRELLLVHIFFDKCTVQQTLHHIHTYLCLCIRTWHKLHSGSSAQFHTSPAQMFGGHCVFPSLTPLHMCLLMGDNTHLFPISINGQPLTGNNALPSSASSGSRPLRGRTVNFPALPLHLSGQLIEEAEEGSTPCCQ